MDPLTQQFKYKPAGGEITVYLVCGGIATGSYAFKFGFVDGSTRDKEGNIEKPDKYKFKAEEGLKTIEVKITSVPFMAAEPGTYTLMFQQEGEAQQKTKTIEDNQPMSVVLVTA